MKKIGLLSVLTLLSSGLILGVTSCGNKQPTTPDEDQEVEVVEDLTKFEGKVTIGGKEYTCTLKMTEASHTFEFNVVAEGEEDITPLSGSYSYEKGFGYTFFFAGENTPVVSTYNETTKSHEIKYLVKLGGEGNNGECTLVMKDSKFEKVTLTAKEKFVRNATFDAYFMIPAETEGGRGSFGLQRAKFNYDGTFKITGMKADEKEFLPDYDKEGTYTFENNTFTLKIGDASYASKYDLVTRNYSIDLGNHVVLNYNPTIGNPTLTGKNPDFMGFGFTTSLFMYEDHTVFIDITTPMKSMNQMLDIRGTWAIDPETKNRVVSYKTQDQKGNKHEFSIPVLPKEGKEGEFTFDFKMVGSDGPTETHCEGKINPVFALTGTKAMGPDSIKMAAKFTGKDTAHVDIDGQIHMDDELTYTFANNVITLKNAANKTFTSTFDEATGTYTVKGYEYNYTHPQFGPGTMGADLSYKLW